MSVAAVLHVTIHQMLAGRERRDCGSTRSADGVMHQTGLKERKKRGKFEVV